MSKFWCYFGLYSRSTKLEAHGLRNEFYLISYMAFRPTDVRKENRGFEPLRGASLEQDPL
jgi:hypothetical protein